MRWGPCQFCSAQGWDSPGAFALNPLRNHDRPDGRRCLQAKEKPRLVVKLDNPEYPGSGGTVVALVRTVDEYLGLIRDRDGAHDPRFRLWDGDARVGDVVRLP